MKENQAAHVKQNRVTAKDEKMAVLETHSVGRQGTGVAWSQAVVTASLATSVPHFVCLD